MTDEEIDKIIIGVYLGSININSLPVELYVTIVSRFGDGLVSGFGAVNTLEERALFESLYLNIQKFSGAKTANMILDFEAMLVKDGEIVEFAVFQKEVLGKYNTYMKAYLKTEYNFIVESAKAAKRWTNIQANKGTFDLLEYVTVGDERTRDSHKILDGVVEPVDNAFWNSYYPPWEWNCRCTTKSYSSEDYTPTKIV